MENQYLLFRKDTIIFFTKKKKEVFFLSELIAGSKPLNSVSQFDEYKKKFNFIFSKLLEKIVFQINKELVILFDYPWTKPVFLSIPLFSQRKIKKIIQFELQKKSWQDNFPIEQDFYTIANKEKKKKRVVAYSMEKQQIAVISSLLLKKKVALISIAPYTHLLEQGICNFIKKRKKNILVMIFTDKHLNCYFYDKVGLKSFYPLVIKKIIDKKFWNSFKILIQRISLFQGNNFDIFYKNKDKFILLNIKDKYPDIVLDNLSYSQINKQYRVIKKSLEFIPDKMKWNFSYWLSRFKFFKKKLALSRDSLFIRIFLRSQFIILFSITIFFIVNILNLRTQKLENQIDKKKKIYQKYLNVYQLNSNVALKDIDISLKEKIKEWQDLNIQQERFLPKNYTFSDILLFLARSKGKIVGLEIIRLELEENQSILEARAEENIFKEFKKSLLNYFVIVEEKYNSDSKFIITFTRK